MAVEKGHWVRVPNQGSWRKRGRERTRGRSSESRNLQEEKMTEKNGRHSTPEGESPEGSRKNEVGMNDDEQTYPRCGGTKALLNSARAAHHKQPYDREARSGEVAPRARVILVLHNVPSERLSRSRTPIVNQPSLTGPQSVWPAPLPRRAPNLFPDGVKGPWGSPGTW